MLGMAQPLTQSTEALRGMQVNVHCWIVTKVAPSNGALGVMSCVHLAQTCSHKILCFTCCLHEGRNAPWSSQGPQQKFKSPALLPRKRRLLDVPIFSPPKRRMGENSQFVPLNLCSACRDSSTCRVATISRRPSIMRTQRQNSQLLEVS